MTDEVPPIADAAPQPAAPETPEAEAARLVESSTLLGDLRDEILKRLRTMPKPWTVMSEREQLDLIDSVERVARQLIRDVAGVIAGQGQPTVEGVLDKCVFKDGIQVTIKVSKFEEDRHGIADAVGGPVRIVIADTKQFTEDTPRAKVDKDQPNLPGTEPTDGAPAPESNVTGFRSREAKSEND